MVKELILMNAFQFLFGKLFHSWGQILKSKSETPSPFFRYTGILVVLILGTWLTYASALQDDCLGHGKLFCRYFYLRNIFWLILQKKSCNCESYLNVFPNVWHGVNSALKYFSERVHFSQSYGINTSEMLQTKLCKKTWKSGSLQCTYSPGTVCG